MILDWDKIEIVEDKSTAVNLTAEDRMIVFSGEKGSDGTKGDRGKDGIAATVAVGTVTTLPSNADATVVNRGTPTAAVFDFGIPRGASGSGGASMWGEITGTLSDQTDLQTALNAKANTADLGTLATQDDVDYENDVTNKPTLGTMSAVDDAPSNGSEYVRKNGQWAVASSGGSTSASWGAITGNLSNQTDLKNALDDKADESGIAEEWVSENAYLEGALMTHEGKLYKAIQSFQTTEWDANNVQETTVSDLIAGKADSASLGTMASVNDAPSNGNEYVRKNGAWAVSSGGGGTVVSAAWGDITGTLSDQTDLANALSAKANSADVYTKTQADNLLADKANASNVYSKTETDNLLAGKLSSVAWGDIGGTLANQTDLQSALTAKADASSVYTKTETDALLNAKANTADLGDLATQNTVDYTTDVTNKPTLGGIKVRPDYEIVDSTNEPTDGVTSLATGKIIFVYEA